MEGFTLSTVLAQCPGVTQAWGDELVDRTFLRSSNLLEVSHESVLGLHCALAQLKRLITEAQESAAQDSEVHQVAMEVPTIEEALKETAPGQANAAFANDAFADNEIHAIAEMILVGVADAVKELDEYQKTHGFAGFMNIL